MSAAQNHRPKKQGQTPFSSVGFLILLLAGVVLALGACEPKPPKPKVFSTHERSML
jgi:hypothetical protein